MLSKLQVIRGPIHDLTEGLKFIGQALETIANELEGNIPIGKIIFAKQGSHILTGKH
jgi:hypothetical protein